MTKRLMLGLLLVLAGAGGLAFYLLGGSAPPPVEATVPDAQNETANGQVANGQTEDLENMLYLDLKDGRVVIKLRPDLAPGHVERITELAKEGFYDGVVFHRVIPGFMAQGGDPTGTGMGGSEKPDLKAEFNAEPHVRGVCSMARSSFPDSANSQFFICFDDARFLDNQYTVWGEVTEGMEHVDALPKGEPPRAPGKIVKATVS